MKLTSTAFEHEGMIPQKYTCDGASISPPLKISAIPAKTVSFVLIMDDPDVPKSIRQDGIWDHWIVFNIPANTTYIAESEEPRGIHGVGTSGDTKYYAPCPPDSRHHYFFNCYALDAMLDLPVGATKQQIMKAMEGHVLEKAILIGLYERKSIVKK
ncbi:MAG: YbhB/YbcL family Raf kinase inhibitor-like protein [Gammaproteobacteria bacterium CG_4_10_14_0_8_um_filter_38_16]|nr:MAG: YbhB/YbcL family Raf kinase inhibitor-like protein [Gammaproteobacteria bacterium CG_4_10_14_0_8_um_filter_38_16]PJA02840.1 MAG: YbhB/YbcL family Raf kinase inhibitor-like protein [Gammaproteobacteria bacterium CG_4_10_14_0_2_um_filter_38_22]PJB10310.1 MAG: YbhB/YbcL family Raf kinase inhibitor-like protein [Gammaproteobacteria bacterium CG_4_9_14_3_um_filter_38_9]